MSSGKRAGERGNDSRRRKRQRYKQYSTTTKGRDLGNGARGFLISCTPKHEVQCFRDAVILLNQHIDVDALTVQQQLNSVPESAAKNGEDSITKGTEPQIELAVVGNPATVAPVRATKNLAPTAADDEPAKSSSIPGQVGQSVDDVTNASSSKPGNSADVSESLKAELSALKHPKKSLFTRVDMNVSGSIFVRIDDRRVDLEAVAESILQRAQTSQSPGCRFCIKIIPVHSTCYAKAEDVVSAAMRVVAHAFPADGASYAIQFKARMNSGAHRDEYINVIAGAIDKEFPQRYKVNLTKPDVVLLVEVMKTSCCIGAFRKYFELGKMNVREACKPKKDSAAVKQSDAAETVPSPTGADEGNDASGNGKDAVPAGDQSEVVEPEKRVGSEKEGIIDDLSEVKDSKNSNTAVG